MLQHFFAAFNLMWQKIRDIKLLHITVHKNGKAVWKLDW